MRGAGVGGGGWLGAWLLGTAARRSGPDVGKPASIAAVPGLMEEEGNAGLAAVPYVASNRTADEGGALSLSRACKGPARD